MHRMLNASILTCVLALACAVVEGRGITDGAKSSQDLIYGVITPHCFDVFFNKHDFLNQQCLKLTISKVLGYAIIAGAFLLKAPQIAKIISAGDVTGLAPSSFYMEVLVYLATVMYNFLLGYPISTWGEAAVVLVQNIFLVFLLWAYGKPRTSFFTSVFYTALFGGIIYGMLLIPHEHRWTLSVVTMPLAIASRLPQIWSNFKLGHTGRLALLTVLLNFIGALARAFTTLAETSDMYNLSGYALSVLLNGTLLSQIFIYWNATNKALAVADKKKTK